MFGSGLEKEVIISVMPRTYEVEGAFGEIRTRTAEFDRLLVWANKGLTESFRAIPGVIYVTVDRDAQVRYILGVDPRYSLKWVMAEIEAVAKLQKSEPPQKQIEYHQVFSTPMSDDAMEMFFRDSSESDSGVAYV